MYELIRSVVDTSLSAECLRKAGFIDGEITVIESRDGIDSGNLEEGTFHIVFPVIAKNFHFAEVGGVKVKHNPDLFPSITQTFSFQDIPVAKTRGTDIFLLFSCGEDGRGLLESIFSSLVPKALEAREEWMKGKFRSVMALAIDQRLSDYRQRIKENEEELRSLEEKLSNLVRQINTDKQALTVLDGTKGEWMTRAEKEFSSLRNLIPNLYRKIFVDGDNLVALTQKVEIIHDGKEYEIGEFEVRITLHSGDLDIRNLTGMTKECDHPHIREGKPCLGNIGPGVIMMIAEFELFGSLQMLHSFLHSYNEDSPYVKIEHWDPDYVEEDRYETCHQDHRGFDCIECGGEDGDCPFYDDAFEVCFEDSTVEDCTGCDYLCALGRQRIREHQTQESEVQNG